MIKPLPSVKNGNAGAFYLWFNFGLLVALIFWSFSFSMCYVKGDMISVLVWFLCVWLYGGINNQMIWLVIVLLYTYKYVYNSAINE